MIEEDFKQYCERHREAITKSMNEQTRVNTEILVKLAEFGAKLNAIDDRITRSEARSEERFTKIEMRINDIDDRLSKVEKNLWKIIGVISALISTGSAGAAAMAVKFFG